MFKLKETKTKIRRIEDLEHANFNIPRMYYVEPSMHFKKIDERILGCILWAKDINQKDLKQIFNIRTYEYYERTSEETHMSEHVTDIEFENLEKELNRLLTTKHCMIDAETPDNGIIAGNVIVHQNPTARAIKTFIIEFCIKPVRAMVRDHDISISGNLEDGTNTLYELYEKVLKDEDNVKEVSNILKNIDPHYTIPSILSAILCKTSKFHRKDVILEWTVFNQPAGIFFDKEEIPLPPRMTVWWEYITH